MAAPPPRRLKADAILQRLFRLNSQADVTPAEARDWLRLLDEAAARLEPSVYADLVAAEAAKYRASTGLNPWSGNPEDEEIW